MNFERLLSLSNVIYLFGSALTLAATLAIVILSGKVTKAKELELAAFRKDAEARIAEANTSSEIAKQRAQEANAVAEQSRLDKEKLVNDNLLLQKQIEDEKLARERIEQRLAPRSLNALEAKIFTEKLAANPPQSLDVVTFVGDDEASKLAKSLVALFVQAGWKINYFSPIAGSYKGVMAEYDSNDGVAMSAAVALTELLKRSGLEQKLFYYRPLPNIMEQIGTHGSSPNVTHANIRVFVGSK